MRCRSKSDAPAHVIVGASLAGATAAITLRAEGAAGAVVLIGDEPEPPYERARVSQTREQRQIS